MNPTQLALQRLQQPPPVTPMQSNTNPTTGPIPAGDIGHNGPLPANVQEAQQIASQSMQSQQSGSTDQTAPQKGAVDYKQLQAKGFTATQIEGFLSDNPGVTLKNAPDNWDANIKQNTIIPKAASVTEHYGDIQPGVEVFSGGFTSGTGIGVKAGTPLATPPGKWKVVDSFDQAPQKGYIGNGANSGWGNSVLLQNVQTGEELRYSHLSQVGVATGDTINGSRVIGLSGQSGNTTGDHLNLEYITPQGQPADVLQSQYAKYLPIK